DSTRKIQLLVEIGPNRLNWPVANRISARLNSTTTVRIRGARSELMSSTPILAKIAVSAAKAADSNAQSSQEGSVSGLMRGPSDSKGRHCEERSDEAIHTSVRIDGLLRGVYHRARIRATRWLAMTQQINFYRPAVPAAATPRRLRRSARALRPAKLRRRSGGARYRHNASCALRWGSARRHCRRFSRCDRATP